MHIRKATLNDVPGIVDIHISAFPDFFLTTLGKSFLNFYYKCFIQSSLGLVLCVEEKGELLAFSATSLTSSGFNKKLIINNLLSFFILSLKLTLFSPKSLIRLIQNINKKGTDQDVKLDYAELFSIGVSEKYHGQGIGKKILFETEKLVRDNNIFNLSLTTDYYNNEATIAFYKTMGYKVFYEFTAYPNRKMYRFIKDIK